MKTESEEAKNLDQFLSDMSEVFEIPKRTLKKMVFPFDGEVETISKDKALHEEPTSRSAPSTVGT